MIRPKTLIYKLYLLLTISSLNTFGQEGNKFEVKAKFHPSALLALSRPTMLGSIEFKLNKIGLDIAYGQQWGFLLSSKPDTLRVKNFGNQYRADIKYYFKEFKNNEQTSPFISIGYCKMYTQKNITQDWFSGYIFNPSLATINNLNVYYLNYGICKNFGRIVAKGAVSGGVRFRTEESVYANKVVFDKASRTFPHLSLSLRIGYTLANGTRGQGKEEFKKWFLDVLR
jgi:hypothetical protein